MVWLLVLVFGCDPAAANACRSPDREIVLRYDSEFACYTGKVAVLFNEREQRRLATPVVGWPATVRVETDCAPVTRPIA